MFSRDTGRLRSNIETTKVEIGRIAQFLGELFQLFGKYGIKMYNEMYFDIDRFTVWFGYDGLVRKKSISVFDQHGSVVGEMEEVENAHSGN